MRRKLSSAVYYHGGGMWFSWDGDPKGPIHITFDRALAHGGEGDPDGPGWIGTPFQGINGQCRPGAIGRLAFEWQRSME